MEKRIASPELINDPAARHLLDTLESISNELNISDSIFYYNFPIFRDESNHLYRSKVLFATRSHGLFVFAFVAKIDREQENLLTADVDLTQLDSILYGKFLRSSTLRKSKRDIHIGIHASIYLLEINENDSYTEIESSVISGEGKLKGYITENKQIELTDVQWDELISLLEGTKAISRQDERDVSRLSPNSKAIALSKIEDKIATFDVEQRHAAISIVKGPQRIRGIAGSGKTIVLAMRAAHIHLSDPDAVILLTFWTKSLYDMFKQMITKFYRQFDDKDPNWEKVHVLHAWGGRSTPGVYFNTCMENGVRAQSLRGIVPQNNRTKFEQACFDLIASTKLYKKYDYILIDEGQDLPSSFYQLCFNISIGDDFDRNIIWAYDELQTIMDVKPQDVAKTFGVDMNNTPLIDLDRASQSLSDGLFPHDIVLKKSYRNPPEVLMCAHALGLGLYNRQPVQILEDKQHWEDLGYEVIKGNCLAEEDTVITMPIQNSPLNLSDYSDQNEIIKFQQFKEFSDEIGWVSSEIMKFIDEGLLPHDILVISLDDRNAKSYFSAISENLMENGISVNNLQNSKYTVPKFVVDGHVSMSTVYKAKGNEAAIVFVIGVDALSDFLGDRRARNMLFTAFTRSRAWLRVSGIEPYANDVMREMELAINNYPCFKFKYPDSKKIQTIQRDLSEKSVKLREMQQMMLELGLTEGDLDLLKNKLRHKTFKKK